MVNKAKLQEAEGYIKKALNDKKEFQYHFSRRDAFVRARDIYKKLGRTDLADKANYDASIFGFTLHNMISKDSTRKRYGRFAPMMIGRDKSGKEVCYPDLAWIDRKMLEHAGSRVMTEKNPMVLAIYYDLLFEYSKTKDKKSFIAGAIDNYIKTAAIQFKNGWFFEFLDSLIRAYEIALKTKDKKRQKKMISLMFGYIEKLNKEGNPRYLLEIFKALIGNIDSLKQKEIEDLIKSAKSGAQYYGSLKDGKYHLQRSFLKIIKDVYRKQKNQELEKSILLEISKSYFAEANEKKGSGLVEAHFLQKGLGALQEAGDPNKEKKEILAKIERANLKSQDEMKTISVEEKIDTRVIKKLVSSILGKDKSKFLLRIGKSSLLIPSYEKAKDTAKKLSKEYPLQNIFNSAILQDGRKIYEEKSSYEIDEDKIIKQFNFCINLNGSVLLSSIFDEIKRQGITGEDIGDYFSDKDLFQYGNFEALREGLHNYDDKQYFSCLSVLTTQLEHILRETVKRLGKPTLKIADGSGNQQVVFIKELIEELKPYFPLDLYWYLVLITYDKRGLCLRDSTSHALIKHSNQNKIQVYILIHVLLILATYELKQINTKHQEVKE